MIKGGITVTCKYWMQYYQEKKSTEMALRSSKTIYFCQKQTGKQQGLMVNVYAYVSS